MEEKSRIRNRNSVGRIRGSIRIRTKTFQIRNNAFFSHFLVSWIFSFFGPHIPWEDGRFGMGEVRALTRRMTLAYFQLFCDPGRYDRESPTKQAGGLTAS
jgi:hypothetical protein